MKIPKRVRKILNKSGKKPCDICRDAQILEEHHIEGRDIPNFNHPSNLANICSNCHTKVHHGQIIIEKWVQTTKGKELLWHSVNKNSFSGCDSKPHIIP
jgi:hypothetical protein